MPTDAKPVFRLDALRPKLAAFAISPAQADELDGPGKSPYLASSVIATQKGAAGPSPILT
jgi:hypothetical protein